MKRVEELLDLAMGNITQALFIVSSMDRQGRAREARSQISHEKNRQERPRKVRKRAARR